VQVGLLLSVLSSHVGDAQKANDAARDDDSNKHYRAEGYVFEAGGSGQIKGVRHLVKSPIGLTGVT